MSIFRIYQSVLNVYFKYRILESSCSWFDPDCQSLVHGLTKIWLPITLTMQI
jgi:hypothetical protein